MGVSFVPEFPNFRARQIKKQPILANSKVFAARLDKNTVNLSQFELLLLANSKISRWRLSKLEWLLLANSKNFLCAAEQNTPKFSAPRLELLYPK
jgi:hypothetical protein